MMMKTPAQDDSLSATPIQIKESSKDKVDRNCHMFESTEKRFAQLEVTNSDESVTQKSM